MLTTALAVQCHGEAVLGGFLAGAVTPRDPEWQRDVEAKLESIISVLLPMFFGLVGRT